MHKHRANKDDISEVKKHAQLMLQKDKSILRLYVREKWVYTDDVIEIEKYTQILNQKEKGTLWWAYTHDVKERNYINAVEKRKKMHRTSNKNLKKHADCLTQRKRHT